MFRYYQKLIALCKELDVIVFGRYALLEPEHPDLFVCTRTPGDESLLVMCNFSEEAQAYSISGEYREAETLIAHYPDPAPADTLRPWEAVVLRRR